MALNDMSVNKLLQRTHAALGVQTQDKSFPDLTNVFPIKLNTT